MFKETARILSLIALVDCISVGLGVLWSGSSWLWGNGAANLDVPLLIACGALGHLSCTFVVPLLWRKRLKTALIWTYGPVALAAFAAGYMAGAATSMLLIGFVLLGWTCVVGWALPPEWDAPRRGLCKTCGYSLRGNQSGRCPECGAHLSTGGRQAKTPNA
jgi:hypothetical protein